MNAGVRAMSECRLRNIPVLTVAPPIPGPETNGGERVKTIKEEEVRN